MILDEIVKNKKKEVKENKKKIGLNSFKSRLKKSSRNFKKAISKKGRLCIIAEIKKASPSEGVIRKDFDVEKIAKEYKKSKVDALSVLTDKKFFHGDMENIKKAKIAKLPILRKDFIIDEYQVYESRYIGADAILLIASILSKNQIDRYIKIAKKYNMDCVVEVHSPTELQKVLKTNADIIGINNRNLKIFKVDLNTTIRLARNIPKNKVIVSESGFKTRNDVAKVKDCVDAVLIGTTFMKAKNIGKKVRELRK